MSHLPLFKFGKYGGVPRNEVPDDYINYMINNSENTVLECKAELARRQLKVDNSIMKRILDSGRDALITQGLDKVTVELAHKRLTDQLLEAAKVPDVNKP
jgi:hypothetical protein